MESELDDVRMFGMGDDFLSESEVLLLWGALWDNLLVPPDNGELRPPNTSSINGGSRRRRDNLLTTAPGPSMTSLFFRGLSSVPPEITYSPRPLLLMNSLCGCGLVGNLGGSLS